MLAIGSVKVRLKVAFVVMLVALFFAVPASAKAGAPYGHGSLPFFAHVTGVGGPAPSGSPPWEQDVFGSGVATSMGLVSVSQHHWVAPTADPNKLNFYDGTSVWTAANGDVLFGVYAGYLQYNSAGYFEIHGNFVWTGGTGRFQGATGAGLASGAQHLDGTFDLRLDGTITH
jgi:hypothetical protein